MRLEKQDTKSAYVFASDLERIRSPRGCVVRGSLGAIDVMR